MYYVIFSTNLSYYIQIKYRFHFEFHIILTDYFTASYLFSANEASHDGSLQDRWSEMDQDIELL